MSVRAARQYQEAVSSIRAMPRVTRMVYAGVMGGSERPSFGLRSVSDTALLVAWHRGVETKRPDALFRDQLAVRLGAERAALKWRAGVVRLRRATAC